MRSVNLSRILGKRTKRSLAPIGGGRRRPAGTDGPRAVRRASTAKRDYKESTEHGVAGTVKNSMRSKKVKKIKKNSKNARLANIHNNK